MAHIFTQREVNELYLEWYRSGTASSFRVYFAISEEEMKQIETLKKPENPYE